MRSAAAMGPEEPQEPLKLREKTIRGVKWNFLSQFGQQITQLLTTVVLARLLSPGDFGLVGMAVVIIGLLSIFKDLGTAAAVIKEREISDEMLCSVFWLNAGFGVFAFVLLYFGAPLGALYYRDPRVIPIIRVLAVGFLFSSLSILQQALLEKKLRFQLLAKIELRSTLVGSVVGIVLALLGKGVWALVFQSLSNAFAATTALWWASRWRPSFRFNPREVRKIWKFSANLTGFNVFNYFARNADYLLIGRFLGPFALGLYTLAYKLMLYPLQSITNVISRVIFPAFSEAQDDNARLRRGYLRTVSIIGMATFPMMIGLWVVASPFVASLFGPKWQPVVPLIRIFAPLGIFQSVVATVGAIYQAKGRTDLLLRWGIFSGVIYVAGFAFGLRWGIIGVAVTYMALNLSLVIPSLLIPFMLIELRLAEVCRALKGPLVGSLFMGLAVLGLHNVLPPMSPLLTLQVLMLLGVVTYVFASWMVNREQVKQVLSLVGLKSW